MISEPAKETHVGFKQGAQPWFRQRIEPHIPVYQQAAIKPRDLRVQRNPRPLRYRVDKGAEQLPNPL